MADDQRGGHGVSGQGIQIGNNNTQVNNFGGSQRATAGRDIYMSGGDMTVNRPSAREDEPSAANPAPATSLSGQQEGRLRDALVAAFDEETLEVFLLEKLDRDLAHLTPSKGDFPYRVFKLIRRADQEGWLTDLISEAARARPASAPLRDLADETGTSGIDADWGGLERIIIPASGFQDVGGWRERLAELEERVCRLKLPVAGGSALGTGLLVAPDLVLTNFHLIASPGGQAGDLSEARVLFGHRLAANGTVVDPGTEYRLGDDPVVAARRPSNVDALRNPGNRLPGADELDFALLRLATPAGRAPVPGASRARGWERLTPPDPATLRASHPLLVLQYPKGDPLKLALGQSLGPNGNGTRLRHTVSTLPGSSGSPCLNAKLQVVAIHQAGDHPDYNAAIPVAAILQCLAGSAVARELAAGPD
jgi:hypothetical protein